MTGPEHYREADRILTELVRSEIGHAPEFPPETLLAMAQVHATLAAAAAAALNDGSRGLDQRDYKTWYNVAGVKPDNPR